MQQQQQQPWGEKCKVGKCLKCGACVEKQTVKMQNGCVNNLEELATFYNKKQKGRERDR